MLDNSGCQMILDAGCQLHLADHLVPRTEAAVPTFLRSSESSHAFQTNMYTLLLYLFAVSCHQGERSRKNKKKQRKEDPCRGNKPSTGVCYRQAGVEPPVGGVKARYPKRTLRGQEPNCAHTTSAVRSIVQLSDIVLSVNAFTFMRNASS
jgi:hypothetical protein